MRYFLLFSLLIICCSCSSPLDKAYKESEVEEDMIALKDAVSEEELGMIVGYIALQSLQGESMLGKTYGDLLNEAKEMRAENERKEAEEEELARKAKQEEAERIERLSSALTVTVFEKGFSKGDWEDYITFKFAFENKTDKPIKAFTGAMVFNDLFDKEIKILDLTYDDEIAGGERKTWDASTEYNRFIDEDAILKEKGLDDMKIQWIPEKILFEDGTALE